MTLTTAVSMYIGVEAKLSWVRERVRGEEVEMAGSTTQELLQ